MFDPPPAFYSDRIWCDRKFNYWKVFSICATFDTPNCWVSWFLHWYIRSITYDRLFSAVHQLFHLIYNIFIHRRSIYFLYLSGISDFKRTCIISKHWRVNSKKSFTFFKFTKSDDKNELKGDVFLSRFFLWFRIIAAYRATAVVFLTEIQTRRNNKNFYANNKPENSYFYHPNQLCNYFQFNFF